MVPASCGRAERLLVLDNVEDAESVRPWLPRDPTTGCRTLITSRFADWPAAAGIRVIHLYVLEPEPARRHCQLSCPWYARCVGGAAARVGRSFARLLCCPALTERGRKKAPWVR